MKNIINVINNNQLLCSIIGGSIGSLITTFLTIFINDRERRKNKREEIKNIRRQQIENKAELRIISEVKDESNLPHINLFMTDFTMKKAKDTVIFCYRKNVLNTKKYKHIIFYVKNIGNSDINVLDICSATKQRIMLTDINLVEDIVKNNVVDYSYCYDRKILKDEVIVVDIAYIEESKICNEFSCELALLYSDSYHNSYKQPFFIRNSNLYEPKQISYSEYMDYINTDKAINDLKYI